MYHYLNTQSILRSFMKLKKTLVNNVSFVILTVVILGYLIYYLGYKYRENMKVGQLKVDEPSGLFNMIDIFRHKPRNVEIEIDNTKTQQHIISIPDNSAKVLPTTLKNDVSSDRQVPDYCKYNFGTVNQNLLEICREDKPICDGYEFIEGSWGKCIAE